MKTARNRKIIDFPSTVSPATSERCQTCGAPTQLAGVCRQCAVYLVDFALSSTLENFPKLVEDLAIEEKTFSKPVPLTFEHYAICHSEPGVPWELGRGSMGITYKAMDTHLGCPVTLKVINTGHLAGTEARERFLHEARTTARLRHPNIASVFHLGLDETNCFYAMEYIEGETLETYVTRHGRFPVAHALDITFQCVKALRFAHEQGFVHRDIKPTNIMLVGNEYGSDAKLLVKVIDFGLVKATAHDPPGELYNQNYFAGTPFYASPEQLTGGVVDARTDFYSLGRCLWHMLSGQIPSPSISSSRGSTRPTDQEAILCGSLENAPPTVARLLGSMMATQLSLRPTTANDLLRSLQECMAEVRQVNHAKTGECRPRNDARETSRKNFRRKAWGNLVFIALFFIGGGWLFESAKRPPAQGVSRTVVPVEDRVLYERAVECLRKNTKADNQHAIDFLSKITSEQPEFADAHAALSKARFQSVVRFGAPPAQIDQALENAQRAMAIDPNAPQGFVSLAAIRSWQGRHWDALTQLHRALELDPKFVRAMHDFGLLWSAVGRPELGLPWSKAAAEIDPTNPWGWIMAADACTDLCDDVQAVEFYERCLEINPMFVEAHCGLLHIHLLEGDFAAARQEYVLAEAIEAGLPLPLILKAQIDLFSGSYEAAETSYRRLLVLDRGGAVSYYSGISYLSALAYLRARAGDTTESVALLDEASKMHVSDTEGPQAIYDLAAIRSVQGHQNDAISLLRRAIAAGWMDVRATRLDPRFEQLRGKPEFTTLLMGLDAHIVKMQGVARTLCVKSLRIADYPVRTTAQ